MNTSATKRQRIIGWAAAYVVLLVTIAGTKGWEAAAWVLVGTVVVLFSLHARIEVAKLQLLFCEEDSDLSQSAESDQ